VQAIHRVLVGLPKWMPSVVVVQHMPENFTSAFARRLQSDSGISMDVTEGVKNQACAPGVVVIVPGNRHGVVRRHSTGYRLDLIEGPPVSRHRPSVDVLFRSVALAGGPKTLGVLLTGMGADGAVGLWEMHAAGAMTLVQDEASSVVFGMPREAIRRGAAKRILPLDRIPDFLIAWGQGESLSSLGSL
jgi:two-component system chemotaxis response regulator CheB